MVYPHLLAMEVSAETTSKVATFRILPWGGNTRKKGRRRESERQRVSKREKETESATQMFGQMLLSNLTYRYLYIGIAISEINR